MLKEIEVEKIVSGKKSQIANAQNKTYSVEDHVVKSYAMSPSCLPPGRAALYALCFASTFK